jgi:hypothetical protein
MGQAAAVNFRAKSAPESLYEYIRHCASGKKGNQEGGEQ